jgi:triacylglycerol lipase
VRGSKNLVNYVQDAEFWEAGLSELPQDMCDGCKLHSGFMGYWEAVEPDVLVSLEKLGCTANATDAKSRRVFVTGHSLGAAAATLGMFKLQHYGFDVQQGYVFESPRLGNPAFANAFAKKFDRDVPVFRVTHQRDPVVHLPPQNGKGGILPPYQHVKGEVYFLVTKDPMQKAFCGEGENELCSDRYDLTSCIVHGDDHCNTPLLENGDICNPPPGVCGPASVAMV